MYVSPRSILAAAVAAAAALGTPALAHTSRTARAEPPALAGRTVVTGSTAAAVLVRVPFTTTVSGRWDRNPSISVAGGGEFVGLSLVDADDPNNTVSAVRLPRSAGGRLMVSGSGRYQGDGIELRRGTYWLHLAPGGRAAQVTLSLPGLAGTRRLTPRTPIRAAEATLTPSATAQGGGVTYGAGHDVNLQRPGLVVTVLTFTRTGASPADHLGSCWYSGASLAVPAAARYTPSCPGASSASFLQTEPLLTAKGERMGVIGMGTAGPGRQAFGVTAAVAGGFEKAEASGFYLQYATG